MASTADTTCEEMLRKIMREKIISPKRPGEFSPIKMFNPNL